MRLIVGTSGFSYPEWRGTFYPEKLPESSMLRVYAERLPSVEINNTFYRMPQRAVLDGWAQKVPDSFRFALKAPRRITHIGKLKNVNDALEYFVTTAQALGDKLGPLLFQLPPTFRKDETLLDEFLTLCPAGIRVAFEFRHASWFEDSVYARLSERGVALCATEVDPDEGIDSPFVKTAAFTYVRLRRAAYDESSLAGALDRVRALPVDEAFVYFKHEVLGPSYAQSLMSKS